MRGQGGEGPWRLERGGEEGNNSRTGDYEGER